MNNVLFQYGTAKVFPDCADKLSMNFSINCYQTDFQCALNGQEMTVEGILWKEFKSLRFIPNTKVFTKFNRKTVEGTLIRFTSKKAIISINGKEKRDDLVDFVMNNRFIEVCYRIEKNGIGPYRTTDGSPEFMAWKAKQRELLHARIEHGVSHIQPTPEMDHGLSLYPLMGHYCRFGFKSFEQLFQWFDLQEMNLLIKEGFTVVTKQKGLDYYGSFSSSSQIAYAVTEDDYQSVLKCERSFYY